MQSIYELLLDKHVLYCSQKWAFEAIKPSDLLTCFWRSQTSYYAYINKNETRLRNEFKLFYCHQ